jgi:hypothetical protein
MKGQEVNINDFVKAIHQSDLDMVKDFVLNKKIDINEPGYNMPPFLVQAIYSQNAQIIDFFCNKGLRLIQKLNIYLKPLLLKALLELLVIWRLNLIQFKILIILSDKRRYSSLGYGFVMENYFPLPCVEKLVVLQ